MITQPIPPPSQRTNKKEWLLNNAKSSTEAMYVCVGCVVSLFAKCDFSHLLLGDTARDGGQEIIGQGVQSTIENENIFKKKQLNKK